MAEVISGDVSLRTGRDDLTVILLNRDETRALTDLLEYTSQTKTFNLWSTLDELTNAMLGASDYLS